MEERAQKAWVRRTRRGERYWVVNSDPQEGPRVYSVIEKGDAFDDRMWASGRCRLTKEEAMELMRDEAEERRREQQRAAARERYHRRKAAAEARAAGEKALERRLNLRVWQTGGLSMKYSNANVAGYPDRLLLYPGGVAGWVELKSPGAVARPLQKARHVTLRGLGFRVWVCDTPESVDAAVEELAAASRRTLARQGEGPEG